VLNKLYERCAPEVFELACPDGAVFRNAQYLSATVEVDPRAMGAWLPSGVKLARPGRADLFCAYFPENSFESAYREVGLFVHIQLGKQIGIHCPWIIVDDDIALILGREVAGYPKKIGQIAWQQNGDEIVASGSRRGASLVAMRATLGELIADPPPIIGRPHRNVLGTLGISVPRLVAFTPREINIETRRVELDLQVSGSHADPLHAMGLGDVIEARLHRVDIAVSRVPPVPVRLLNPLHMLRNLRPRVL
jgi:acetoacetate decarboxylase